MGSLATAMTNLAQHIHAATEQRSANLSQLWGETKAATEQRSARLSELRAETQRFLGECRTADRQRAKDESARVEAVQAFMRSTRVRVSELRSDTHNLLQRFTLEHRDKARTLRGKLTSEEKARVDAARQARQQRQATQNELRVNTRTFLKNLQKTSADRQQAVRQTLDELAADRIQAGEIWREGLKKKEPPSVAQVTMKAAESIREVAEAPVAVEEPVRVVPAEEPRGEVAVEEEEEPRGEVTAEEEQAIRTAARAERVLAVIQAHPDGIRLVEIGNEMGVDWRGLIAVVRSLMDEGKVEKIDDVYYPAQR